MRRRARRVLATLGLATLAGCLPPGPPVPPVPPAEPCPPASRLSEDQRRQLLHHYSPLILKQADERAGRDGRDWITNFDFDGDSDLSNNRSHWIFQLWRIAKGIDPPSWAIRPTLYSHAIEFSECGAKSVILVYHIYHAMQFDSIHDWERVEIRLDGVAGGPGNGESIRFAVITEHSWHRARAPANLRFYDNPPHGKHLLVWQAPWSFSAKAQGLSAASPPPADPPMHLTAELRFVEEDWSRLDQILQVGGKAAVHIGGVAAPTTFHYVFLDGANPTAVAHLQAASVDANPPALASGGGWGDEKDGTEVKRVVYELQDTADVMVTHAQLGGDAGGSWFCSSDECDHPCGSGRGWTCRDVPIEIEDPLLDEAANPVVPAGTHLFLAKSCDTLDPLQGRNGYPWKHWWWGTYLYDRDDKFTREAFDQGLPNGPLHGTRDAANQCSGCLGDRWMQHDYFSHSGVAASGGGESERGEWLPHGWHRAVNGGSDGRWLQIFSD